MENGVDPRLIQLGEEWADWTIQVKNASSAIAHYEYQRAIRDIQTEIADIALNTVDVV